MQTLVICDVYPVGGEKKTLEKQDGFNEFEYGLPKGFLYNDKPQQWLRYCKDGGGQATELTAPEA